MKPGDLVKCQFRAYDHRHRLSAPPGTVGVVVGLVTSSYDGWELGEVARVLFTVDGERFEAKVNPYSLELVPEPDRD